jgi:integrase
VPPTAGVFHGQLIGVTMSDMTLRAVLKPMDVGGLTAHGFRSTFRDWGAEETVRANHVLEQALVHVIIDMGGSGLPARRPCSRSARADG